MLKWKWYEMMLKNTTKSREFESSRRNEALTQKGVRTSKRECYQEKAQIHVVMFDYCYQITL